MPAGFALRFQLFSNLLLVLFFKSFNLNVAVNVESNFEKYVEKASFCHSKEGHNCEDNGGWFTDTASRLVQEGPCNIDVVDKGLSQNKFLAEYAFKKPVILRAANNKIFADKATRKALLEKYGEKEIILSSANTHSYTKIRAQLKDYLEKMVKPQELDMLGNETLYWFGDNNHTEWAELFNSYQPPPYTLPGLSPVYSFGVAGPGTGVPFHFHGPGFAEVIYGRKRWFLYPPGSAMNFNPDKSTLVWFMEQYSQLPPNKALLECTIKPGEVIYFPDQWWHATLNVDTSVFISTFLG